MESIRSQHTVLHELMKLEEQILSLQDSLQAIPVAISKLKTTLDASEKEFEGLKAALDSGEKELRRKESDLRDAEEKIRKAESKMMEVKTNEEYKAAMKEVEGQKQEKSGLEDKILEEITQLETRRKQLQDSKKEFETKKQGLMGEIGTLEKEFASLQNEVQAVQSRRQAEMAKLSPEIADQYAKVAIKVKGVPVALVENYQCFGCRIKVRAQLFNEVLGFQTVHRCPNCSRILVYLGSPKAPEANAKP